MSTAPTTLVTGVDFMTLPTQDLDAARAFYADVLGLAPGPVYQRGDDTPAIGAEFETANLTLSILDMAAVGQEFSPMRSPIALRVDDVEAARAELESRGVTFFHQLDSGVCHMAFFNDPDGNNLMLHHRYAPRTPPNG
jgi:catechol 2,3-dioxygenase-like lactoylglutathione lyase family enzyme